MDGLSILSPGPDLGEVPINASDILELEQIVARGESAQVEFKLSTGQRGAAAKTVCAMLNGSGGFVLFGVRDDRIITGQEVTSDTLEAVVRELRRIEPFPPVQPEVIELSPGRAVILVRVPKGGGPYLYDGRPYLRVGPVTMAMPQDHYARMLVEQTMPDRRWELQPAAGIGIDDLDHDEIVRTAEEAIRRGRMGDPGTRRVEDLLADFGLVSKGVVLKAAVVLFGRSDRLFPAYAQCTLRLARFRGRDSTEFEDSRQEVGNAFDLLQRAQRFLRDHLPVAGRVVPSLYERVDDPMYPPVALREALANAFCHRDYAIAGGSVGVAVYDDRLEILSTGRLRFGLRPEHLGEPHPSLPWNPVIAEVFYRRGLIERWGRGTLKIRELAQRAGLTRPEFEERASEVVVRFFPSGYIPPARVSYDLTDLQRALLVLLADYGPSSSTKLAERLEGRYSDRHLRSNLNQLADLGLVEKKGTTRGVVWRLIGRVIGPTHTEDPELPDTSESVPDTSESVPNPSG